MASSKRTNTKLRAEQNSPRVFIGLTLTTEIRVLKELSGAELPAEVKRTASSAALPASSRPRIPYIPIMTLHVPGRGERANSNALTAWSNENRSVTS